MRIVRNTATISDLLNWYEEGSLTINKNYQREKGLWPNNARTFFIDTILNDFPFPKIILRQTIDLKRNKTTREIIDGQQRFQTISDFFKNILKLSSVSKNYSNIFYKDLNDEEKNSFLAYEVSIDTAIAISETEVVEIFRRINSYMLPLNEPEKRHAKYQGEFKWFIVDLISQYSPMLDIYKILSDRAISRMEDADLFSELILFIEEGEIISKSAPKLDYLYKRYDIEFNKKKEYYSKFTDVMNFIKTDLSEICKSELLTVVTFHSLFIALYDRKYNSKENLFPELKVEHGYFVSNINETNQNLFLLLNALVKNDTSPSYSEFVRACTKTTSSIISRKIRVKYFLNSLS